MNYKQKKRVTRKQLICDIKENFIKRLMNESLSMKETKRVVEQVAKCNKILFDLDLECV